MMNFSVDSPSGVFAIEKDRVMPAPGIVRSTYCPAQKRNGLDNLTSSSLMSCVSAVIFVSVASYSLTAIERRIRSSS